MSWTEIAQYTVPMGCEAAVGWGAPRDDAGRATVITEQHARVRIWAESATARQRELIAEFDTTDSLDRRDRLPALPESGERLHADQRISIGVDLDQLREEPTIRVPITLYDQRIPYKHTITEDSADVETTTITRHDDLRSQYRDSFEEQPEIDRRSDLQKWWSRQQD